jgi:Tol biopolymer transport system component
MLERFTHVVASIRLCVGRLLLMATTMVLALSCSHHPSRPKSGIIPPSYLAGSPYGDPVWSPDGTHLLFDHLPLRSLSYDPTTGDVRYDWIDSLGGWWVIRADGTDLHRHMALYPGAPDISRDGTKLVCWLLTSVGPRLFTFPLVGGLPDSAGLAVLPTPGRADVPRWNPAADSVVYFQRQDQPIGAWIVGANGGGAHLVHSQLDYPDWDSSSPRLLGVVNGHSAGRLTSSQIVEYRLDTGAQRILLNSASSQYFLPRYAPDGSEIAFLQRPLTGGEPLELWIADSIGSQPRRLVGSSVLNSYAWSPTGTDIAYVAFSSLDFTLSNGTNWIVTVASGNKRQLTFNP